MEWGGVALLRSLERSSNLILQLLQILLVDLKGLPQLEEVGFTVHTYVLNFCDLLGGLLACLDLGIKGSDSSDDGARLGSVYNFLLLHGSMAKQIMGIDPGTANFGWCVVDSETLLPVRGGSVRLPASKTTEGGDAKVVNGVVSVLEPLVEGVEVVVCEQQMRRKMDIVCGSVLGYARGRKKQILSVAPASVKRRFDIPPGRCREKNKVLALAKCKEWGLAFETDHIADAYLCARYAALILKGEKKKNVSTRQSIVPSSGGGPCRGSLLLHLESDV